MAAPKKKVKPGQVRAATRKVMNARAKAQANPSAPAPKAAQLPFLEAVKRELDGAGFTAKAIPVLVLLYLASKAL